MTDKIVRTQAERVFSIELSSGSDLRKVNVPNGSQRVMMEGTIGSLRRAEFIEDSVLELVGTKGVLRVDLSKLDLARQFLKPQER
jgi:hypothetical protein